MVSRGPKGGSLFEKLQLLRSVTNSHAVNKTSIILDASKYIKELKRKVEILNADIAFEQNSTDQDDQLPVVKVESLEKGFLIHVYLEKSCSGLLVSILEAFEELGLNVTEASISCTDRFHLEAIGGEDNDQVESMDAQAVKQAILQAIENCSGCDDQE